VKLHRVTSPNRIMVPPLESNRRVALFTTANTKPSDAWLTNAIERAYKHDEGIDTPLVPVDEGEVNTAGWSNQQVAEWVFNNLSSTEDDRASRTFVVADDKSEATDSLVIVTINCSECAKKGQISPLEKESMTAADSTHDKD
jgi:hypothetical protein